MEFNHKSVLLNESIEGLNIKPDGIYVDGTIGGAGHSLEIVKKLSKNGSLIGIDRDKTALEVSSKRLEKYKEKCNIKLIYGNHDDIKQIINSLGIQEVDGILLDLGVSSYQLDEKERGFSYMSENSKLDMRMDESQVFSAFDIVNKYKEEEIARILWEYGEEKFSRRIAKNIILSRKEKEIQTTGELVDIIKKSIPKKFQNEGHPAKRTFQAIRIEVNNEIEPLYKTIEQSIDILKKDGRLCVITFHSLEDRAVKKAMQKAEGICTCPKELPQCVCGAKELGKRVNKKPIEPSLKEQEENSRSKSAKLRIFEKTI